MAQPSKFNLYLKLMPILIVASILFSIVNLFTGNPLSAAIADKEALKYVSDKYPNLKLTLEKAHYTVKDSVYIVHAQSKTSRDTHFDIYVRGGKVKFDYYDSDVLTKFNTITRLENTYATQIAPLLAKVEGLQKKVEGIEGNLHMVSYEDYEEMKKSDLIKLDVPFEKNLPFRPKLILRTDMEEPTVKQAAKIFEGAYKVMKSKGYNMDSYELFSEYKDVLVMIEGVKPSDIESGQLEVLLEKGKSNETGEGLRVDIHKVEQ